MKGYKGFEPGLICKGKQYAENTVFEEPDADICHKGMHFCENPFDVLDYYGFVRDDGSFNEFSPVEALEPCKTNDHKKFCTTKLKIMEKLSFGGFVKACVDFVLEKTKYDGSSGYGAKIGSSGDGAKIDCTGNDSVVCCAGLGCAVKAKKGCWITLSEWKKNENGRYVPVCVKTEYVDGERIKEGVFYKLENGEFKETTK